MSILNGFVPRIEQQSSKVIGSTECTKDNVSNMLVGMLSSMGMTNPQGVQTKSSKGVKISKKGNNYTLTLSMYEPPIVISWTGNIPMDKLSEIIDRLAQDRKKIGYMNIVTLKNKVKFFQLALSN